jgi:hypothetical protein
MNQQLEVMLYPRHSMAMGGYCTPMEAKNLLQMPGMKSSVLSSAVCNQSQCLYVIPATDI